MERREPQAPRMRIDHEALVKLGLAVLGGLLMRWSFGLHPLWWLAWVAPAPLLVAVLRSGPRLAHALAFLAGLIASSGELHYWRIVNPLPWALLNMVLVALLWMMVIGQARRVMVAVASPWAVLAYPLFWCASDTLLAWLHPDGNWISLAYSQAGFVPALQIVSLLGMAGLVFVLSLVPSALALAVVRGWHVGRWPLAAAVLAAAACLGYGQARIPARPSPQGELVGMAVIDDTIGPRTAPAQAERIWSQYERHVEALAGQGARIVLLPEKIAVLDPAAAILLRARMAALAARTRVWLALGVGMSEARKTNHMWLFAPDGRQAADYLKHHLAPPEREYAAGSVFSVQPIGAMPYGLAICKDVHFAAFGRDYAALGAQALLVPAWDFGEDGEYAARQSTLRNVESGFAQVRAAREGMLTISDAYGRVVAEKHSAGLPGVTLLGRVPVEPIAPPYAAGYDLFGWLCTAAALCLAASFRRGAKISLRRTRPPYAAGS